MYFNCEIHKNYAKNCFYTTLSSKINLLFGRIFIIWVKPAWVYAAKDSGASLENIKIQDLHRSDTVEG